MEDKSFELLEKMYVEMKNGFNQVNQRIASLEAKTNKNTMMLEAVKNKHSCRGSAESYGYVIQAT